MNETILTSILEKLALYFEFSKYLGLSNPTFTTKEDFISELRNNIEKNGVLLI